MTCIQMLKEGIAATDISTFRKGFYNPVPPPPVSQSYWRSHVENVTFGDWALTALEEDWGSFPAFTWRLTMVFNSSSRGI